MDAAFDVGPDAASDLCSECDGPSTLPSLAEEGVCDRGAYACPFDPAIVRVTSLADAGPGTFREAMQRVGPRVIIFDISGNIELASKITLDSARGCVHVAGQTAPGPVVIRGGIEFISADHVVLQHLAIQAEDEPHAMEFAGCEGVVLDHLTLTYGTLATLDFGTSTAASISNSILIPVLQAPDTLQAYAALGRGDTLFYRNLFSLHLQRAPFVSGSTRIYNNYLYGSSFRNMQLVADVRAAVVGNRTVSSLEEGPTAISPILGVGGEWSDSTVFVASNETDSRAETLVGLIPEEALVDSNPFAPRCSIELASTDTLLANVGSRPVERSALETSIVTQARSGTGVVLSRPDDGPGYTRVGTDTRALSAPDEPHEVLSSGYTRLEEWLHARAEMVE
ncbi:MAG: hypothetical protein AAF938_15750 [Myxococcota bacterium]